MANKARDFVAKFFTDTAKFDTDQPVKDLDRMADASDTASKRMDQSFDRIKRSADTNIDDLGTKGKGRAGEAGAEVGTEFAANIGESIASGQANIGDLLSGTLGGLVAVPGLGIAAAGLGIAGLFVNGMLGGIAASKQKLADAAQRAVDSIDVDLTKFAAKFDASKFLNDSIDALTEGGLTEDIAKFKDLATQTVGEDTLSRILLGKGTQADFDELKRMSVGTIADIRDGVSKEEQKQRDAAKEVLALLEQQKGAYQAANDAVKTQIDLQRKLSGYIQTNVGLLKQADVRKFAPGIAFGPNLPTDDR